MDHVYPNMSDVEKNKRKANYRDMLFVENGKLLSTAQVTNTLAR